MKTLLSFLITIALTTAAYAADVSGTWKAEFDTQRGLQKYTITLKQDGATVTGKASVETADQKRDVEFKEVKVEGDTVTFVETLNAQGNELRIVYIGKFSANEIKFARKVGDISTSEAVAKKDAAPAPAQKEKSAENANLPVPPTGWDAVKSVPHGEVKQSISYPTRNNGLQLYSIWLPPGYSTDKKYPVLYMLHGLGDNQTTWINQTKGRANNILDNYLADKKIVPMLVVFPNGALGETGNMGNFAKFSDLLFNDLIPHIDQTYSTLTNPVNRAIGGLSMGGGQSLKFGLPRTDLFNWIGAFAPAAANSAAQNVPEPSVIKAKVRFIYLAVGTTDRLKGSAEQYHKFFDDNGIAHVYQLEQGLGHDWTCFNRCFYNFVPHIFTETSTNPNN